MCGRKKCGHDVADLCSCRPVQEGDTVKMFQHLIDNLTNETWELDYNDLSRSEDRRLCLVGVCSKCGGRLCLSISDSTGLLGNDFVIYTYQQLCHFYRCSCRHISNQEFWDRFIQLFHEQDRPLISDWRTWLEEQYKEETV